MTGDFGKFDEEKFVYIVDRKNDMIISGGKNIYPREIEEIIYRHESVLDVAVLGIPDDYWGESVKALVVLKEGMTATQEEIINLCKERLASYKKPKSVEFREELPRSPTGKVLKRKIREEFWSPGIDGCRSKKGGDQGKEQLMQDEMCSNGYKKTFLWFIIRLKEGDL